MTAKSVAFDRAAEYYDATRGFPPGVSQHIGPTLVKAGQFTSASRALEIGVGTGRIALPTAPHLRAYVGIDLARPMMERLVFKHSDEPVYLALADATRLPFAPHSFDGVIAVHVFHLIPNWNDALREVARVLRPGAALIHCFGRGHHLNNEVRALSDVWENAVPQDHAGMVGVSWRAHDTFLAEAGWREVRREVYTYQDTTSPQEFLDYREKRLGSGTWRLTDAQIAVGVEALKRYIAEHYADSNQPIVIDNAFSAIAYLPPEN
jgi:ubiquinone/menaquinone biosynthesis C-methylase UbiE